MVIHEDSCADSGTCEMQDNRELSAVLKEIDNMAGGGDSIVDSKEPSIAGEHGQNSMSNGSTSSIRDEDKRSSNDEVTHHNHQVEEENFVELDLRPDESNKTKIEPTSSIEQPNYRESQVSPSVSEKQLEEGLSDQNKDAGKCSCTGIKAMGYKEEDSGNSNPAVGKKTGLLRHLIAILALSSIVLANMNRQAFNQALVSMTKKPKSALETAADIVEAGLSTDSPTTVSANTIKNLYYDTFDTTSDLAPTHEPQIELNSKFNASKPPPEESDTSTVSFVELKEASLPVEPLDEDEDRFAWTEAQVGVLQSAFSYGYMPFMIPSGRMSEVYGAKWVVFLSGFGSAFCCLIVPLLADTSFALLVVSRVFMGFCQTGVSPALYALLTRWLPPDESSVYLPMIKVGVMVGYMSGSLVSGFFTWRLTFYITALIGLLWSLLWVFTVTSDPKKHNLISKSELNYIQDELAKHNKGKAMSSKESRKKSAPWLEILTNPVVLAFMIAKFTVKSSTDAQAQQIPMYLKNVFAVSDKLNGVLSATNFAIQGLFTGLVAYSAKEFVVRRTFGIGKTGVRRLFQGINNFGMAFAFILISFNMGSLAVVCFAVIILSITSMFGAGGEAVTPVDLSMEYSASIMAIANSCANLSGIVQPTIIALLLGDDIYSADRWNFVWRTLGAIVTAGGLLFTFKVNAKDQEFGSKALNIEMKDIKS